MTRARQSGPIASPSAAAAELARRLRARQAEIEEAVLARVLGIAAPSRPPEPAYAEGLRAAVGAALEHGLEAIERGEERSPRPPPTLLAQARLGARNGLSLDTLLRRYIAGQALLIDFLVEEAERGGLVGGARLQRLLRAQAALFDRLVAALGKEHARGAKGASRSSEARRSECIERLLIGEPIDAPELGYDFDAHHLALVMRGAGALGALGEVATEPGARPLALRRGGGTVWAWLGGPSALDPAELKRCLAAAAAPSLSLAIGEPGVGLRGWRLSHRQASAAMVVARRGPERVVRYADVALLALALQDELLASSLRRLYLEPLEAERDGGEALRETLRAYFAADLNVTTTAAELGVKRHTVTHRLRVVEELIGCSLGSCAGEVETVLGVEQLGEPARVNAWRTVGPTRTEAQTGRSEGDRQPRWPRT